MTISNSNRHHMVQLIMLLLVGSAVLFRSDAYVSTFNRNVTYNRLIRYLHSPVVDDQSLTDLVHYLRSVGDYDALGILELWQGHYSEASQCFSMALKENPSNSISRYFLADALYKMGEHEGALDQWAQVGASAATERYISTARESVAQSDVAHKLGLAEMAVEKLAPHSPDVYAQLAEVYEFHNDSLGAIKSYRRAAVLENNPSRLSNLLIRLGRVLRRNNQQQDALAAFRRAAALVPSEPNTHLQLADQYAHIGLYAKASVSFERALSADPHNSHVLVTIGNFYKMQGRHREAETWYRRAIDADPSLGFGEFNLGRLALGEGKPQEAIVYLEQAIQLGWDSYPVWLELGYAYRDAGNLDKAVEAFRHVVEMDNTPPHAVVVALTNLAAVYMSRGELQLAQVAWDNVLKIDPNNQAALDALRELP